MKNLLFAVCLLSSGLARSAEPGLPTPAQLRKDDPKALVSQFVAADAKGLQTSSANWALVEAFTDWKDGPGYDTAVVARSSVVGEATVKGSRAVVPVTYSYIGDLSYSGSADCPKRECVELKPRDPATAVVSFELNRTDKGWVIMGPQSGPVVGVEFALAHARQDPLRCREGSCDRDPAVLALKKALKPLGR